jgi:hypothetical protein
MLISIRSYISGVVEEFQKWSQNFVEKADNMARALKMLETNVEKQRGAAGSMSKA